MAATWLVHGRRPRNWDLLIVDRMLPGLDGLGLCAPCARGGIARQFCS